MPSFKTSVAVLATALFSMSVHSQATYYVDPANVPLSTRQSWCTSQTNACPLLCTQLNNGSTTTSANDCDADNLTFDCVCGNGLSPNATEYSQTLPYFICTEYGQECVKACGGATACQSACLQDHPCGAQNPIKVNVSTATSTPTSTADAGGSTGTGGAVTYDGLGGASTTTAAASSSKKSGSNAALDLGRSYSLAVVFAGLFAGFALVL